MGSALQKISSADAISKSIATAQSVIGAVTSGTPVAITVAESQMVGRASGGDVGALTQAQIRTLIAVVSDTAYGASWSSVTDVAPSKKAVHTQMELKLTGSYSSSAEITAGTEAAKAIAPDQLKAAGIIAPSFASSAQINAGSEAAKQIAPDQLKASNYGKRIMEIKLVDDATSLSTGDGKIIVCIPLELNGMNLTQAEAMVSTVSSLNNPTYQIRNVTDSVDMLTNRITIDATEYTSYTAATRSSVNTTYDDVATGDRIAIDKDVQGTGEKGDTIILTFSLP